MLNARTVVKIGGFLVIVRDSPFYDMVSEIVEGSYFFLNMCGSMLSWRSHICSKSWNQVI